MNKQRHFEVVEDQIVLEGFVHTKGQKTVVVEDVLIYENPKTNKYIKLEKGGLRNDTNIFGDPKQWSKDDLQGYINLLLESSRFAKNKDKKREIFFQAKSLATGKRAFGEYFRGMPKSFFNEEQLNYINKTKKEAEYFFESGKCSFASQDIKYKETLAYS